MAEKLTITKKEFDRQVELLVKVAKMTSEKATETVSELYDVAAPKADEFTPDVEIVKTAIQGLTIRDGYYRMVFTRKDGKVTWTLAAGRDSAIVRTTGKTLTGTAKDGKTLMTWDTLQTFADYVLGTGKYDTKAPGHQGLAVLSRKAEVAAYVKEHGVKMVASK